MISIALRYREVVILLALIVLFLGIRSYQNLAIDAFPELSPVQVKVIIKASGMTPKEVESKLLIPIESAMQGLSKKRSIKSLAKYGICDITIDFEDDAEIYWARNEVSHRLSEIKDTLPEGIEGGIAPISTPLSDMLMFTIESDTLDLMQKRSLLEWVIAPKLRGIAGVAEVNILGGELKSYEVVADVHRLQAYALSVEDLYDAIVKNHQNSGLGRLDRGANSIFVRGVGQLSSVEEIASLSIASIGGRSIKVGDVADVRISHLPREGFVTKDGKGEAVQGIVLALRDTNTQKLIDSAKKEIKRLNDSLEGEARIEIFYDRSELVDLATSTIKMALLQATILISLVLLLSLGSVASAMSVALVLPFSLLMSFIAMEIFGLSANLMSLGGLAIAIGMLVDSSIVVVEHIVVRLSEARSSRDRLGIVLEATKAMAPSIAIGVAIIIIVFVPLLSLEGLEGKLFKPVALSIIFALTSSLVLSLVLIPIIASFLLRSNQKSTTNEGVLRVYGSVLDLTFKYAKSVLSVVALLFVLSLYALFNTGRAFMPTMDEGDLVLLIDSLPSISLQESVELNSALQTRLMHSIPEIRSIVARSGTDELGLDPMSLNDTDAFLVLDKSKKHQKEIVETKLREVLSEFEGVEATLSQPIEMRIEEMLSGTRGDLAVQIYGDDELKLDEIALRIRDLIEGIKGSSDVYKKSNDGVEYLEVFYKDEALSRYKTTKEEVAGFLHSAISTRSMGYIYEGLRRIPFVLRSADSGSLEELMFLNRSGELVPLTSLVELRRRSAEVEILHEDAHKKSVVQSSVEGRDLVGFVEEIRSSIDEHIALPAGYFIEYGGSFVSQQRASKTLSYIVPVALFMIFLLLFALFRSLRLAFLVLLNIPLALIGGFFALYVSGEYLSVPASVGFIALLGIAILNGVVLVDYFNQLRSKGYDLLEAVKNGSLERLRPVSITALTTALGLAPLLFASGAGSELQRPLAIVVTGGLVSSTLLTLLLLPLLYYLTQRQK